MKSDKEIGGKVILGQCNGADQLIYRAYAWHTRQMEHVVVIAYNIWHKAAGVRSAACCVLIAHNL